LIDRRFVFIKEFKLMKKNKLLLFLVLLIGLFFRIKGISWDQGFALHPDERMIVMVAEKISLPTDWQTVFQPESSLNPDFFAYGSLPIYLLKFVSWLVSLFAGSFWANYSHLFVVGRFLSMVFDLGVVLLVYKISDKLFNKQAALLASFLYATTVFPIQLSHFYAVDSLLNFFVWLTLWFLIGLYEKPNFKNSFKVGVSFGLALATKVSATALLSAIGTCLVVEFILLGFKFWRERKENIFARLALIFKKAKETELFLEIIKRLFVYGGVICISAAVVFVIFEPYAVIDFDNFYRQIVAQNQMTKNAYVFPYTLQYVGTKAYLYPLKNIVVYGLGAGLGSLAMISLVGYFFWLVKRVKKPGQYNQEAKEIIFFIFFLAYFFVVGQFAVKFMRYYLPLYPFMIIVTSVVLVRIKNVVGKSYSLIISLLIIVHLFWTFSFASIYSRPHSRASATEWILKNIAPGSTIATEHWDDRLPLSGAEKYVFLELPMYEPDQSAGKWQIVENSLKTADYIILSSNRLYVPLTKLADCSRFKVCYPKTAKYYQDLFSGRLGFELVAEFSSNPEVRIGDWGYQINDQQADESFTVYDHPRVIILKKIMKEGW